MENNLSAILYTIGSAVFVWASALVKKYMESIIDHTNKTSNTFTVHAQKMADLSIDLASVKNHSELAAQKLDSQIEFLKTELKTTRSIIESRTENLEAGLKNTVAFRGELINVAEAISSLEKRMNNQTASLAKVASILEDHKKKLEDRA